MIDGLSLYPVRLGSKTVPEAVRSSSGSVAVPEPAFGEPPARVGPYLPRGLPGASVLTGWA